MKEPNIKPRFGTNCKILFLAFNKSIIEEVREKIPFGGVEIKTFHSFGYSLIRSKFNPPSGKKKRPSVCPNDNDTPQKKKNLAEKLYKNTFLALCNDLYVFYTISKNYFHLLVIIEKERSTISRL